MTVDLFRAATPAVLGTCTGLALGYFIYKQFVENCFNTMPRQALHAKTLGFIHPATDEYVFFESELPKDFRTVLTKWEKVNETYDLGENS